MHNGLSIYQTKYCKITFLALPRLSYILCNRPAVGKTTLLRQKSQQPLILTELQQNWQKLINICCSFNKISMNRKKTVLQEKFDPTINFDFFLPNNLVFPHGMSVKFGLWTFQRL